MPIVQDPTDRILQIIFVEDAVPEDERATANYAYQTWIKNWLTGDVNRSFEAMCNKFYMKGVHTFKVQYFGLNEQTGVITPYITNKPYGYFSRKTPINPDDPINEEGFDNDAEVSARVRAELQEIVDSGYWDTYKQSDLNYGKNEPNRWDYVWLWVPPKISRTLYPNHRSRQAATSAYITYNGQTILVAYQFGYWSTRTLLHEYMHMVHGSTVTMEALSEVGRKSAPDLYVEGGMPSADPPIEGTPSTNTCIMSGAPTHIMHPLVASCIDDRGILDRIIDTPGNYELQEWVETHDYIVIPCPSDIHTYLILAYNPKKDDWQEPSGNNAVGIVAYVVRYKIAQTETFRSAVYGNWSGIPYGTYSIIEMTLPYGYQNIDEVEYDGTRLRRRPHLIDFTLYDEPTGVRVFLEGFGEDDGIKTATVRVELEEYTMDTGPIVLTPGANSQYNPDTVYATNHKLHIRNYLTYRHKISYDADMSNILLDIETLEQNNNIYRLYTVPGRKTYIQLYTPGGESNIIECTAPAYTHAPICTIMDRTLTSIAIRMKSAGNYYMPGYHIQLLDSQQVIVDEVEYDPIRGEVDHLFSDLSPDTTYTIKSRMASFGEYGPVRTDTTSTLSYIPGTIQIVGVINDLIDTVILTHNHLDEAEQYEITFDDGVAPIVVTVDSDDYTDNAITIPDIPPQTTYSVAVRGKSGIYYSALSDAYSFMSRDIPIVNIEAVTVVINRVEVIWESVDDVASEVTYRVEISKDNFATIDASITTDELTAEFRGLDGSTEYQLRILAIIIDEESDYTYTSFTTDAVVIEITQVVTLELFVYRVYFTMEEGHVYEIDVSLTPDFKTIEWVHGHTHNPGGPNYTEMTGFMHGRAYYIRVKDKHIPGPYSNVWTIRIPTLPKPHGITYNYDTNDQIMSMEWDPFTLFPGGVYEIDVSETPAFIPGTTVIHSTPDDSITIPLDDYSEYDVFIRMRYVVDDVPGLYSPTKQQYVPPTHKTPEIEYVDEGYSEQIKIKHKMYKRITAYTISLTNESGENKKWLIPISDYNKDGTVTIDNLWSYSKYFVTVSPYQEPIVVPDIEGTTPIETKTQPLYTPEILYKMKVTQSECEVYIAYGSDVMDEKVIVQVSQYSDFRTIDKEIEVEEKMTLVVIDGLSPGKRYYVRAWAYKDYDDNWGPEV